MHVRALIRHTFTTQAVLIEELREQSAFLRRELEARTQEQRLETIEAS
jgi:hypothetical protein